jgi:hypothetical protein
MAKGFKLPGPDRYEWTARISPALLSALPALVLAATWLPQVWSALGVVGGIVTTFGVTGLLSHIARDWGRRLQARYPTQMGPGSSVAVMRHSNSQIDATSKARYFAILRAHGLPIPTPAEEANDPLAADEAYASSGAWLREQTRSTKKFPLVHEENISYGFRRNLLALKPVGLPVATASAVVDGLALAHHWPQLDTLFWCGAVVGAGLLMAIAAWLFLIRVAFVADASFCYAERLLAACDSLKPPKPATERKAKAH